MMCSPAFVFFCLSGVLALCSSCGGTSLWSFGIKNASDETFADVAVAADGQTMRTGQSPRGGFRTVGQPGTMPGAADIILSSMNGTVHRVHVLIPPPPATPPNGLDSGTPCVYFIIRSADKVEVTFRDPGFR